VTAYDSSFDIYLRATPTLDYDSDIVRAFISDNSNETAPAPERAISLYYAVRDLIRYDPYLASDHPGDFAASRTLELMRGWCVTKSLLYAACCRAIGLPARLGYADVRNHLSTENLRRLLGTDIFYWHGYTDVFLHGKWVKATPVFNIEMCERFRVKTLEFDGREDSIFHPFDLDGQKHMEYLNFRGTYDDLPFEEISRDFAKYYPRLEAVDSQADFDREVILETSA
jgi:transglutaminase-like putative cysteine protease